ncbi:MAG: N-acyl-D-glucosamine 2-epimerase, partial [Chloroflexota bacterium]
MNEIAWSVSDTIAGYVTDFNRAERWFGMKTSDGREYRVNLTPTTYALFVRNLGEPYADATGRLAELLDNGQHLFVHGVFYPEADGNKYDAKFIVFPGQAPGEYHHESPDWWVKQIKSIADCYLKWQFGYPEKPIDYNEYRTFLHLGGEKNTEDFLQETDTV